MSNLSELFPTGGGGAVSSVYKDYVITTSSTTWVAPYDCTVTFHAIGGGGAGGRNVYSTNYHASGGGAGGYCRKTVEVKSGDSFTLTVGAGGIWTGGVGQPGGNTSISGPNVSMTANGGSAGVATTPGATSGVDGGSASGGDLNFTGGRGGGSSGSQGGGGGGAVRFFTSATPDGGVGFGVSPAVGGSIFTTANRGTGTMATGAVWPSWPPLMGVYPYLGPIPTSTTPGGVGFGGNVNQISGGPFGGGASSTSGSSSTPGGAGGIGGGGGSSLTPSGNGGAGGPGMIVVGIHE